MSSQSSYDYVIVGGGLAGLQLALALSEDKTFSSKSIAIIEPTEKVSNDKTWCFWEKGTGKWDKIVHHQWKSGHFKTTDELFPLDMIEYSYKMIRSSDFYEYAKSELRKNPNVKWVEDKISSVTQNNCKGELGFYLGKYVFDSRVSNDFTTDKKHVHIKQPFKGWLIKTEKAHFDPASFIMMDYTVKYKDLCCFTYVLPTSTTEALVEFTFFVPQLVGESIYDSLLQQYIKECLKLENYTITEIEKGIVPMSSFPFWRENKKSYIKIGTGGGWVKASSGYSFKSTEKKVEKLIDNLKDNRNLDSDLFKNRFRFYDRIMLGILQNENHLGSRIFQEMYSRNSTAKIFKFLDEETTFAEEIKIINSFRKAPFIRSFFKEIK